MVPMLCFTFLLYTIIAPNFLHHTVVSLSIVFTLTPQLLTIFVLNFEQVQLLPNVVSKNCWMSCKQCRP